MPVKRERRRRRGKKSQDEVEEEAQRWGRKPRGSAGSSECTLCCWWDRHGIRHANWIAWIVKRPAFNIFLPLCFLSLQKHYFISIFLFLLEPSPRWRLTERFDNCSAECQLPPRGTGPPPRPTAPRRPGLGLLTPGTWGPDARGPEGTGDSGWGARGCRGLPPEGPALGTGSSTL